MRFKQALLFVNKKKQKNFVLEAVALSYPTPLVIATAAKAGGGNPSSLSPVAQQQMPRIYAPDAACLSVPQYIENSQYKRSEILIV